MIIIENKSSTKNHYKKYGNINYAKNYAVNGAIHYAKKAIENNKNLKIISIGISGYKKDNLLDAYYLSSNSEMKHIGKKLNSLDKYHEQSDYGFESKINSGNIEQLVNTINNTLRDEYELDNYLKPLFISMIMIAFKYNFFEEKVKIKNSPQAKNL